MEKGGVQYRIGEGCYHRSKATTVGPRILWGPWLVEVMGSPHRTSVSRDTVRFKSASGSLTVDLRSNRISSAGHVCPTVAPYPGQQRDILLPQIGD